MQNTPEKKISDTATEGSRSPEVQKPIDEVAADITELYQVATNIIECTENAIKFQENSEPREELQALEVNRQKAAERVKALEAQLKQLQQKSLSRATSRASSLASVEGTPETTSEETNLQSRIEQLLKITEAQSKMIEGMNEEREREEKREVEREKGRQGQIAIQMAELKEMLAQAQKLGFTQTNAVRGAVNQTQQPTHASREENKRETGGKNTCTIS